jgi:amino acid adenylation domain-containing protein
MHYRQDAMTTERAQSIVDNFNHVLGVLTKRMQSANKSQLEEMLVRDVDTVSRSDYRRVVDFSSPLPQKVEACVHELILSRCAAPDADTKYAVEAWDGSFTYAELAKHAKRLARAIANAAGHQTRRRGNHQADSSQLFVPFCLTKSKWTPVAILAIMIAGGACVPLEPSHPPARRNEIVTQVKAKVVITNKSLHDQGLADSFSPNTPVRHVICVDDESAYETANFQKALPTVRAEELCYVIFTSGSSGTPKGVKWSHGALSTSAWEHGRAFYIDSSSRVLQFASHVFDVSVAELVTPLVRGACVVIPPDKDRSDPARIATFMNDMKVTTAIIVPSFARLLVQYPIPTLKTVVQGGEPIGQENIEKWTPKIDQFVIGYGAAETCVNCSQNVFSISTREQKPWIEALGKAFGSRIFIADRSNVDRLMPIGAIGEIVVEGPILADGYLNDPAKTANAFIENPAWIYKTHFRNAPARRRFYRTGDLGRQAMDGSITFMGRADFQVKVRGQRMELGEVRSRVVEFLPEAADVHVDVISPSGEDKSLAAFIAFGHGRDSIDIHLPDDALADAMRNMVAQLKEVLTSAGIPSFFIPLAGFPYLVSGKVDRRRLLAFANQSTVDELASYNASFISTGASEKVALEEPETEAEIILVNCCRRVLGVQDFGVNANFFVSGGDSISAIKVVTAARDNGVDISVSDLFGTSSIRELAERVCHTTSHDSASDIAQKLDSYLEPFRLLQPGQVRDITAEIQRQGIPDSHVSDIYPCTPLQEALIALSSTRCGAYVAQHILTLPRHVDLQAFKSSWEFIYQRHEILRTRIFEGSQGAVQAVCDSEIEWRTGRSVAAYCELDKSLPMSFGSTLVRFGLVDRTFVFTIHHSVFDGWSITRLFEDFERHYVGQQPLEIRQYRSFIKYLQDVDADQPNDFWLSALASNSSLASAHFPQNLAASHSPLPDSAAKSTIPIGHYSKSEFTIPTRIRAAWALLMGRYIDSQEVIFGETLSGRMSKMPQVQDVAGPTISTVPFLVKWEPTASLSSLLQSIQGQVIEMTNYGHVGIQNISRLSKTAHEACQFQHLIVIQPKRSSYRGPEEDTQAMRSQGWPRRRHFGSA